MIVVHKIAIAIADISVARNWIQPQDRPWCAYAVELKLISLLFFLILFPVTILLKVVWEALIFSMVFIVLRSRFGGWHAPYAWLCQVISVGLVLFTTIFVGPAALELPHALLWVADVVLLILVFFQKPVYQEQVHFDAKIQIANKKKKNMLLFAIFFLQIIVSRFFYSFFVYSMLAVLADLLSVYIEMFHQVITTEG